MDTKEADQGELPALEATQERSACQHHWVASLYSMVNPTTSPATTGSGTWGVGVGGGASTDLVGNWPFFEGNWQVEQQPERQHGVAKGVGQPRFRLPYLLMGHEGSVWHQRPLFERIGV